MASSLSLSGPDRTGAPPLPLPPEEAFRPSSCEREADFLPRNLGVRQGSSPPIRNPCLIAPASVIPLVIQESERGLGPLWSQEELDELNLLGAHPLSLVFEYLDLKTLSTIAALANPKHPEINGAIEIASRVLCIGKSKVFSLPPEAPSHKDLLFKFSNIMGPGLWQKYLGEVEKVLPPIPIDFVRQAPFNGYWLVYIPERIRIDLPKNSPLMLDDSTAIGGKQPRLIENADQAPREARQIEVPITPNNIIALIEKCLKKRPLVRFTGLRSAKPNLMKEHGDVKVERAHWSFLKRGLIGDGKHFTLLPIMAKWAGREPTSLIDRLVFILMQSLEIQDPLIGSIERTSTSILDDEGNPLLASILWVRDSHSFKLDLGTFRGAHAGSGIAVGIPAKNS